MRVIKRDGRQEQVSFDKILRRLQLLASGKHNNGDKFGDQLEIDVTPISQQVIMQIRDGITTKELDEFAANPGVRRKSAALPSLEAGEPETNVIRPPRSAPYVAAKMIKSAPKKSAAPIKKKSKTVAPAKRKTKKTHA